MPYGKEEIESQLRLGEDSRWEFKRIVFVGDEPKGPGRNDLADEMAAFANAGGGVLLCSVSDEGTPQAMSGRQLAGLDKLLVETATDTVKPPVRIETHHRELTGNVKVLVVDIPKGDFLHQSPGGAFIRVGNSKRRMTSDESLRLAQKRGQARYLWFDKQPLPDTGFKTLDESLWKPLLSAAGATDPKAALEKLALLSTDDAGVLRATVAGVLLCTQSPEQYLPSACITATCYRGTDRASGQADAQEITGPLDRQIVGAMAFALRNMRVSADKTPAREDVPQYSDKALFEALVNAVVHRDYQIRGSKIRLSMFADRVEIRSPGALPNNLTLDSMSERQSTRNEALASVLGRMPVKGIQGSGERQYFMERRGDGVPTIKRETRELSGADPEYRSIDGSEISLTIPAAPQERNAARTTVTVRTGGLPLHGAELLLLFPNKTWKQAATDAEGVATVDLHTTNLPMTVFAAAPGYAAYVERNWAPGAGALTIEMKGLPGGGSDIFPEATGHLPGLKGRLNPVRDTHDRTYLYASNIAVNEGQQQPVSFFPGEEIGVVDADGYELTVKIVDIVGQSALVEYVNPNYEAKS